MRHKITVDATSKARNTEVDITTKSRNLTANVTRQTVNTGTTDYDALENRPQINGVLLTGDKSLEDLGINIPDSTSDLINDSGFITAEDIPPVPTKTSELQNDSGFITAEDIPPMVTDLGVIDPEPYDDDIYAFLNTLTESGWYKFVFGGDDQTYFVAVQAFYMEDSDTTLVNQHYWGDEEGPIAEYIRAFILEGDEVVGEWSTSYMTLETAVNTFAQKTHVHYEVASGFSTVWVYANSMTYTNGRPVIYTDRSMPAQWYIESFVGTQSPNYAFQRLTDMHDPNVIYQRSGVRSGGRVTWGDWYKFTGEVYTPGR